MAQVRRLPLAGPLVLLAALVLCRLLPAHGVGLYLRLLTATLVFFIPGSLAARALGRRSGSATVVASLVLFAISLGVVLLTRGSLTLALALYGVLGLGALVLASRRIQRSLLAGSGAVLASGALLGGLLWSIAGVLSGDALFHLARARKLLELGDLTPGSVNEFVNGGLHPGYAFPLWHGVLAAISRIAGVDPTAVMSHEPSVLAPLALLIVYEAGFAVFRARSLAVAVVVAQVSLVVFAPGHGGAFVSLAQPASVARQLLFPATIALFFSSLERLTVVNLALVAAAGLALAIVHPSYVLFVCLLLAGFLVARIALARTDLLGGAAALGALAVPAGIYVLALLTLIGDTAGYRPTEKQLHIDLTHYGSQIAHYAGGRYALAPEMLARSGAIAIAALALTALAGFAARRRWSAFILGGALAVFAVTLLPWLFMPFSGEVSLSQARRLGGFYPFAFAFAGGLSVLAACLGALVIPLALIAAVGLQLTWPGHFGYQLGDGGGPGWLVWASALCAAIALLVATFRRTSDGREHVGPLVAIAAVVFALPVAISGFAHWTPRERVDKQALTPGLVAALRTEVAPRSVVLADLSTSYRILAAAPVYAVAVPPAHVANTNKNRPFKRRRTLNRFFRTGDLTIARHMGATWLVLRSGEERQLELELPSVYRDDRFTLLRMPPR